MSYIDKSGYYQEFLKMKKVKPIHKFNGGIGATLCNNCGRMISEGMIEELYCDNCKTENEARYKAYMEDKLNEFKYNLMAEAWREDEDEPKGTKEL